MMTRTGQFPSTREAARIALQRSPVGEKASLERAIEQALRLSAQTLRVARVGFWLVDEGFHSICLTSLFDVRAGMSAPRDVIVLDDAPRYAVALRTRRAVAVDDVQTDPRTAELLPYLDKHGITGLLDSPIFAEGEIVGVVCHEHIGERRHFSTADKDFAATVADMLGLYFVQERARIADEELAATRQELARARVMESLGCMARGVAHDFNNVLGAIRLHLDGLDKRAAAGRPLALENTVDDLRRLVGQGARLSEQLVTFARREPHEVDSSDLVEVLGGLTSFFRALEPLGIVVELRLPDAPCLVELSRSRLEQVITNLVVNARDAMVGGGTLRVEVSTPKAPDAGVTLRVADTGVGMDEHVKARVFEPFFTTKPRGEGTGLGLATVYGVLTAARADVDVESAPGEGTTITITFPPLTRVSQA